MVFFKPTKFRRRKQKTKNKKQHLIQIWKIFSKVALLVASSMPTIHFGHSYTTWFSSRLRYFHCPYGKLPQLHKIHCHWRTMVIQKIIPHSLQWPLWVLMPTLKSNNDVCRIGDSCPAKILRSDTVTQITLASRVVAWKQATECRSS